MLIGEVAAAAGTTARAVRHYERAGLITSHRAANGYRVYDPGTVARVRNIRHFVAAGLTLADVGHFRSCLDGDDVRMAEPSPAGLRIARARLAVLDRRIATQAATRSRLAAALVPLSEAPAGPLRGGPET